MVFKALVTFLPTNKVCFDVNLNLVGNAFLEQGRILTSGTSRVQWTRVSFYNLLIISLQVLLPTSCFDGNRYFELFVAGLDVL